jgi:hypothetical protein
MLFEKKGKKQYFSFKEKRSENALLQENRRNES